MAELKTGLKGQAEVVVTHDNTAAVMGSGALEVFATPAMVALMENAAMMAARQSLPEESTTVGGQIATTHLRPTGLGHEVRAKATLVREEGRKLYFRIIAEDEDGVIGEADHLRFVVDRERFMAKVTTK